MEGNPLRIRDISNSSVCERMSVRFTRNRALERGKKGRQEDRKGKILPHRAGQK